MRTIKTLSAIFTFLIPLMFLLNGCGGGKKESGEESKKALSKDSIQEAVRQVVYPLPSPFEVNEKLYDIGASYLGDVLNPAGNIDQYFTKKLKAINIGVYAADLSYVITYDKTEAIQQYTQAIETLRKEMEIEIEYPDYSQQELREKLQDKDSLVRFITGIFEKTYSYLNQRENPALSALMAAGMWVEGLYIATHISEDTYNNTEIVQVIYNQKSSLKKIVNLLNKYKSDEDVKVIYDAMSDLMATYENAGSDISRKELEAITSTIAKIRQSMVS